MSWLRRVVGWLWARRREEQWADRGERAVSKEASLFDGQQQVTEGCQPLPATVLGEGASFTPVFFPAPDSWGDCSLLVRPGHG